MTTRRFFLFGASSLLAAPAIVRAGSLMPVKSAVTEITLVPDVLAMVRYMTALSIYPPCIVERDGDGSVIRPLVFKFDGVLLHSSHS